MRATSGRRLHEFPTQFSGAGRTVRSHLRISETTANSSSSAPTSNVGRVLAAKRLRLAAFSVAHVAPLRGLPAALRRLLFAPQNLANITGRSVETGFYFALAEIWVPLLRGIPPPTAPER